MNQSPWSLKNIRFVLLLLPTAWATHQILNYTGFKIINSWQVSDFLISYQSGFTRRGLFGSLLLMLAKAGLVIDPRLISLSLTLISLWLINSLVAIRLRNAPGIAAFLISYSPAFISIFYVLDPAGAGRKDALGLIVLALALSIFEGLSGRTRLAWLTALMLVAAPALILNHESFFFFFFPALLCLYYLSLRTVQGSRWLPWLLGASVPSFLAMAAIWITPSLSLSESQGLCQAWINFLPSIDCTKNNSYFSILNPKGDRFIHEAQGAFLNLKLYLSLLLTAAYLLLMLRGPFFQACKSNLLRQIKPMSQQDPEGEEAQRLLLGLSLLTLIPSLPVYWLATDFGRWFCLSFTTFVLLCLSPGFGRAFLVAWTPIAKKLSFTNKFLPYLRPSKANVALLLLTPFLFMPHYKKPPVLLTLSMAYLEHLQELLKEVVPILK